MSRSVPLLTSASVTLNASGNGQVSLGPSLPRVSWHVENAAVATGQGAANVTNDAECQIFYGNSSNLGQLIDTTQTGSTGDSTNAIAKFPIHTGQVITAVWSGGDNGATATLTIIGTQLIP